MRGLLKEFHPIVNTLLIGTVFLVVAQAMSMLFLPIYLMKEMKMDPVIIGMTIGAGPIAATFGGFFAGTLSDFIGRRKVMLGSLYLSSLTLFGFTMSKHPAVLVILVILLGLCNSFFAPAAKAQMGDVTPAEKRLRVFSIRYMLVNIGYAIGPFLGAFLIVSNHTAPFLIAGCVELIYAITLHVLLGTFDIPKMESSENEGEQKTIWGALRVISSDRVLLYFVLGGMVSVTVYGQWSVPLSQYLDANFAEGVKLFSLLVSVNAVSVILFQLPMSKWAEKKTPGTSIAVGSLLFAIAMVGFGFSTNVWLFGIFMIIFTIGEVLVIPAEFILIDKITPDGMRGTYYGAQSFTTLGSFLGPWMGGIFLTSIGGQYMFFLYAVLALFSVVFFWKGVRHSQPELKRRIESVRTNLN